MTSAMTDWMVVRKFESKAPWNGCTRAVAMHSVHRLEQASSKDCHSLFSMRFKGTRTLA